MQGSWSVIQRADGIHVDPIQHRAAEGRAAILSAGQLAAERMGELEAKLLERARRFADVDKAAEPLQPVV